MKNAEFTPELKKELGKREWAILVASTELRNAKSTVASSKKMPSFHAWAKEDLKAKSAAYKALVSAHAKWMKANNIPSEGDRILV